MSGTEIVVRFSGKKYKIEPLPLRDSEKWRGKVVEVLCQLPKYAKATTDKPKEFTSALRAMMVEGPATMVDLFFEYARDLDRQEIEQIATEEEIATAFEQVAQIAFYLTRSMVRTAEALAEAGEMARDSEHGKCGILVNKIKKAVK